MKNKKSMKKTILLSAITAIAFGSIAVTTSYALFTDSAETNVTVTAGKVDVSASAALTSVYSPTSINNDGTIANDSNAATFTSGQTTGTFANKGSVSIENNEVNLQGIAPGDKAVIKLDIVNNSSIKSKYRINLNSDGNIALFHELNITLSSDASGSSVISTFHEGTNAYYGEYAELDVSTNPDSVYLIVELPSSVTYNLPSKSMTLTLSVAAIQANGPSLNDAYTLPSGITEASFEAVETKDVYTYHSSGALAVQDNVRTNPAVAYYDGKYYDGLTTALLAVNKDTTATDPVIYLKPNAKTYETGVGNINKNVTIYGNNATLAAGESGRIALNGGNSTDSLTSDVDVNVYNLNNVTVWGYRSTSYKFNVNIDNCTIRQIFITNTAEGDAAKTAENNITVSNSVFDVDLGNYFDSAIYSNNNGTVKVSNTVFKGKYYNALNLNHKTEGLQTAILENVTTIDNSIEPRNDDSTYFAPVRLFEKIANATASLSMTNVNSYYSYGKDCINNYDVLLNTLYGTSKTAQGSITYSVDEASNVRINVGDNNVTKQA